MIADPAVTAAAIQRIKHEWCFVFFGCGSEYVLHPLHRFMRAEGWLCHEIDHVVDDAPAKFREVIAQGKRVALISSQHFFYGLALDRHGDSGRVASLFEAAAALQPDFIGYTPHDLSSPLHPEEWPYLKAIDLYLAVEPRELVVQRYCDVELIGWIKRHVDPAPVQRVPPRKAIWLVSGSTSMTNRIGVEKCCDLIAEYARTTLPVKLAYWHNVEHVEQGLRDRGVQVIDSQINSDAVIRAAEVIVTNGSSSVAQETAYHGRPLVVLVDPRLMQWFDQGTWWKLAHLPNLTFVSDLSGLEQAIDAAPQPASPVANLSLDQITQAIVRSIVRRKYSQPFTP